MSDPLAQLFTQFLKERVYLKAVTPKTRVWYETAWKAFKASQTAVGDGGITKARLQAFVVALRDRGVRPRSVNTYLQALNAFCRWLHEEAHQPQLAHLPLLKTEKKVIITVTQPQIRQLLSFKPKGFAQRRVHTVVCLLLDTGLRIDEALRLRPSDVDFDNLLVTVYGKGQKERRLPFSHEMRKLLFRWDQFAAASAKHRDFMFPARNGGMWQQRNSLV